jgi:hypothetical protein
MQKWYIIEEIIKENRMDLQARNKRRMKAIQAQQQVIKATKNEDLIRPSSCELCGSTPDPIKVCYESGTIFRPAIVAHHWRGYDYPLDVWFICAHCNVKLSGEQFHNGSVSKDEAREYVLNFKCAKPEPAWNHSCEFDSCNSFAKTGERFCYQHLPNDNPVCQGITLAGNRCQRKVGLVNGYCFFHWEQDPNRNG